MPNIFSSPCPLIETTRAGHLVTNEDTLKQLMKIRVPVVVVAVAGLYRTGKSFLMNRLAGKSSGFALGNKIESETKGIWLWATQHPERNAILILLDTEGLGDIHKGDPDHDNKIFCLATLLSSCLCYNAKGAIDDDALRKLNFITEISSHLKRTNDDNSDEDFDTFFPHFIYVLRDFTLQLERRGHKLSSDEYFEDCLALKDQGDMNAEKFNLPRQCIRKYFKTRNCFTFSFPVAPGDIHRIDQCTDKELSKEFLAQALNFCRFVYKNAPVKKLDNGQEVNGRMWAAMVRSYVGAIQSGKIPCVQSAVSVMADQENRVLHEKCIQKYSDMMNGLELPTENQEVLSVHHNECMQKVVKEFTSKALFDQEGKYLLEFNNDMKKILDEFMKQNDDASQRKCDGVLQDLEANHAAKMKNGTYLVKGGFVKYQAEIERIKMEYENHHGLGVKKDVVLLDYLEGKANEAQIVATYDNTVTEAERKEQERLEERLRLEKERLEEENKRNRAMQQANEEKRAIEENMKQLELKMEEEMKKQQEHHEEVLEKRLAEQRRLQEEGFRSRLRDIPVPAPSHSVIIIEKEKRRCLIM